jgi:hypothetical protein
VRIKRVKNLETDISESYLQCTIVAKFLETENNATEVGEILQKMEPTSESIGSVNRMA